MHMAWAARFNARDVDGMLEFFEPDAVFVPQPGMPTTGEDSVKFAIDNPFGTA